MDSELCNGKMDSLPDIDIDNCLGIVAQLCIIDMHMRDNDRTSILVGIAITCHMHRVLSLAYNLSSTSLHKSHLQCPCLDSALSDAGSRQLQHACRQEHTSNHEPYDTHTHTHT